MEDEKREDISERESVDLTVNTPADSTVASTVDLTVDFAKETILKMKRYQNRRDILNVLLENGKRYTTKDTDGIIEGFMKEKVK